MVLVAILLLLPLIVQAACRYESVCSKQKTTRTITTAQPFIEVLYVHQTVEAANLK